VLVVK